MTWPAGIAITLGLIATLLILTHQHQHRSTTAAEHPQDGEQRS